MDFTNATFQDFIKTSVGIDVYQEKYYIYGDSKAKILRAFWELESNLTVGKVLYEMLERWRTNVLIESPYISGNKQELYRSCVLIAESLIKKGGGKTASDDEVKFLEKDFGPIDVSKLKVSRPLKAVIDQRFEEAEKCLKAEAALAVVFICGSTIEGLLLDKAIGDSKNFSKAKSAPKDRSSKVIPIQEWKLSDLIRVSRELKIIGEDVFKYAEAVRDFRNYIHPAQQQKENFDPRMITAEMAYKVLQATVLDLSNNK